jgi:uncharacterized protein YbjT (DUF2867 family)
MAGKWSLFIRWTDSILDAGHNTTRRNEMITVMGASGRTGGEVARRLLRAGRPVRALGRSAARLAGLAAAGAEVRAGDAADPAFLTAAFRGADAVYAMLPFDPAAPDHPGAQRRLGEAIVTALRAAGVSTAVALSAVGADQPADARTGFIASLHEQETRLRRLDGSGPDVLLLRPGLYFESLTAALPLIAAQGFNADAVDPDVPLPAVATADVGAAAAAALLAPDWRGVVVRELLGPRDLTYREATRIIGAAIGRPDLTYVQLPDAAMAAALVAAGYAPQAAALHVEMARAFSDGTIAAAGARDAANSTGRPFEAFVAGLVAAAPPAAA